MTVKGPKELGAPRGFGNPRNSQGIWMECVVILGYRNVFAFPLKFRVFVVKWNFEFRNSQPETGSKLA